MIEGVPNEGVLPAALHELHPLLTCTLHYCTHAACTQLEHMYTASVWRERYLQQQTHNQQLEAQLREIERKKDELHGQHRELGMLHMVQVFTYGRSTF